MTFPPKRDRPFVRILFFLIGLVSLGVGLAQLASRVHLLRHGVRTTGRVLARLGHSPPTDSGAHPDIEFLDVHGKSIRYNQNGTGSRPVGTRIPVLYDLADPAGTAVADRFWQLWPTVLLALWLGIGFTAGAIWGDIYSNLDSVRRQTP